MAQYISLCPEHRRKMMDEYFLAETNGTGTCAFCSRAGKQHEFKPKNTKHYTRKSGRKAQYREPWRNF